MQLFLVVPLLHCRCSLQVLTFLAGLQDNLRGPVKLHCGHIFCDDCVSEWLERERTCPMCRAAIRPSNLRSHADGHTTLLPIVF